MTDSLPPIAVTYGEYRILARLDYLEGIMATQEQIDALAERIGTATADIRADIAQIKADHPEVDTSALESRVAGLEGLAGENPSTQP